MKVLGLDLAGSSKRKTGFAYLEKDKLKVGIIYEDEHILKLSQNFDLVMIDAPLSLPEGRRTIEDRGPHFRECDIKLRMYGIRFFPVTLGPMRMLTARALKIKGILEAKGIKVFETFPGGLYDIFGVKRKDKEAIKNFYKSIGFTLEDRDYYQDELDALACLLSGMRYLSCKAMIFDGRDGVIVI
jgi:predicted nuclease with RNAse H fold